MNIAQCSSELWSTQTWGVNYVDLPAPISQLHVLLQTLNHLYRASQMCLYNTFGSIFVLTLLCIFGRLSVFIPIDFNGRNKWAYIRINSWERDKTDSYGTLLPQGLAGGNQSPPPPQPFPCLQSFCHRKIVGAILKWTNQSSTSVISRIDLEMALPICQLLPVADCPPLKAMAENNDWGGGGATC